VANDEANGVRTVQEVDVTGLTLKPTSEGRAAIDRGTDVGLRELERKSQEIRLETLLGPDLYADLQARKAEPEPPRSHRRRTTRAVQGAWVRIAPRASMR
jgi:hypothetical protein